MIENYIVNEYNSTTGIMKYDNKYGLKSWYLLPCGAVGPFPAISPFCNHSNGTR